MQELLSIGQFAALCHTTKNTLIHYDEIGLLHPTMVTSLNRRLYDITQLQQFRLIQSLAALGTPLQEIRQLLSEHSPHMLAQSLHDKIHFYRQQLLFLEHTIMYTDELPFLISILNNSTPDQPVIHFQENTLNLYATRYTAQPSSVSSLYQNMEEHIIRCEANAKHPFPIGCIIKRKSLLPQNNTSFLVFSPDYRDIPNNQTIVKQSGKYASILHKGSLNTISDTVAGLERYVLENNCYIASDTYITFHNNQLLHTSAPIYLIQIMIQEL